MQTKRRISKQCYNCVWWTFLY